MRPIELHGTLASIRVPNPDTFGGDVELSANNRLLNIHDVSSVALARHASHNGLRFFADCAAKKWPLRGSKSNDLRH